MAWAVAGAREDEAAEQPAVRGSMRPSNSNASSHGPAVLHPVNRSFRKSD